MIRRKQPPPVVEAVKGGGYALNLPAEERALLRRLLGELRDLLLAGTDGPLMRRMFPPAYHLADDEDAETEYQRLMHDELVASRLDALGTLDALLGGDAAPSIDADGLAAFMHSVNALRLVLGTLLDVSEDEDELDVADDDPLVGERHLYGYLSYLLDSAVRAAAL
jgi:hypothetical protein